jgi:hypothetical protein
MSRAPVIAILAPTASPTSGRCLSIAQPHSTASATKYPPYTAYTCGDAQQTHRVKLACICSKARCQLVVLTLANCDVPPSPVAG